MPKKKNITQFPFQREKIYSTKVYSGKQLKQHGIKSKGDFSYHFSYVGAADREAFKYCVQEPLSEEGIKMASTDTQIHLWNSSFYFLSLNMEETGFKKIPSETKLKALRKRIQKLSNDLQEKNKLAEELAPLIGELMNASHKLSRLIYSKKDKRQSDHIYPPGVIFTTRTLVKYWNDWTKNKKKISGFGWKGDIPEVGSSIEIDVRHNPSGAFIQRTLKTYFKKNYKNQQITTLLNKVYVKK